LNKIASHHVALRVSDLERATRFYMDAFGAGLGFEMAVDSDYARTVLPAPAGTSGLARLLTLPGGGALELFELAPTPSVPAANQLADAMMHICILVDDVPAVLARVEASGGRRRSSPNQIDRFQVAFSEDPDGHIIELIDATIEDCVATQGERTPALSEPT
jgi:catechol 2,3-dioxygenase-like lactoylglutathione lyase family enzyme